ncbi:MAG: methyl-accepting chemotaxis protein, partial [bacterium]
MHTFSIKRNIALKVSIFIVIFIVILQFISGVISFKSGQWLGEMVENNVVEIVQSNVENLEKTSSADLKELITFNTKMLAGIIRPILYNVEDVKPTLLSFMDVKEIQAVVVFDEEKKSVGAVWRGQGVNKGAALPGDFDTGKLLTSQTKVKNEGAPLGDVVIYYTDKILKDEIAASKKATLERLNAGLKNVEQSQSSVLLWQIVGINGIVIVFLLVMFWLITRILRPLKHLSDVIEDVEMSGMLDRRANVQSEDEIGRTAAAYNKQMTSLQTAVNEITHVVRGLSQGDLQLRVEGGQKGDIEELGNNINQSLEMLSKTISRIIMSSEQVNTGATEMVSSSQDLA